MLLGCVAVSLYGNYSSHTRNFRSSIWKLLFSSMGNFYFHTWKLTLPG